MLFFERRKNDHIETILIGGASHEVDATAAKPGLTGNF